MLDHPEQYTAMVSSSGGHAHGGGETKPHDDGNANASGHGAMPMDGMPMDTIDTVEHRHADGTVESHPAPQPAQADDGHNHEH